METLSCEVLVIGGGSAACRAAIEAKKAGARVLLVDKGRISESGSSPSALVGFSVPLLDPEDTDALFIGDWLKAAGGICDLDLVAACARYGRQIAEDMEKLGVPFITNPDGSWFISKRAGHSVRRTLQARGLGPGVHANVMLPVREAVIKSNVDLLEGVMVTRLLSNQGRVNGAYAVTADGEPIIIKAKAVVLAAGGANRLYSVLCDEVKDERSRTTGDGWRLAFEAGATIVDVEFTQFRDSPPAGPIFGAKYVNALGERIMERYDPVNLECAPRYMMARAVYQENFEGRGPVVWHVEDGQVARSRAPVGHQYQGGQTVPITLMFQRSTGGAWIDSNAATTVEALFAAGESSGGVLGGDRMQGCGFLETQTFGLVAGQNAARFASDHEALEIDETQVLAEQARLSGEGTQDPAEIISRVQSVMWEQAGVVSNNDRLTDAIAKIGALRSSAENLISKQSLFAAEEAANLTLAAELVARAKLAREETRSGHGRTDFPETDDRWVQHVCLSRDSTGNISVSKQPVRSATP